MLFPLKMKILFVISFLVVAALSLSTPSNANSKWIKGVSSIIDSYDCFIIDQWGVMHDGEKPYPGTLECLQYLKKEGKKLIMLSNSSKRKDKSWAGLAKASVDPSLFDALVTSGDLGWDMISDRKVQIHPNSNSKSSNKDDITIDSSSIISKSSDLKLKIFLIGNGDDDDDYVNSANCEYSTIEEADFVLARGTFCIRNGEEAAKYSTAEDLMAAIPPYLALCAARRLPMSISNPDLHRPGSFSPMPGQIGRLYSSLLLRGGVDPGTLIQQIGKPFPSVYERCLQFTAGIDPKRICCIGDSLEHDIKGAADFHLDSLFIANGIHCNELGTNEGSNVIPAREDLDNLLGRKYPHIKPTYIVPCFQK